MHGKRIYYFTVLLVVNMMAAAAASPINRDVPVPPNQNHPQEQLLGQLFFHDLDPWGTHDIYTADLYLVPLSGPGTLTVDSSNDSQYNFEVRNLVDLTNAPSDDFAASANSKKWITFGTIDAQYNSDPSKGEIVYMNTEDRVWHPLTPINDKYSGNNWDPNWKTDEVIVWSHDKKIMEVNINELGISEPVTILPEVGGAQYDPEYSPDFTMIVFNCWQNGKKNCYIKYLADGKIVPVVPLFYYNVYPDDNSHWLFSNSVLTGHIFVDGIARIYIRDLEHDDFFIITDGTRDFRYVTPLKVDNDIYLIFSNWTDEFHSELWICSENGTYLRDLNQTGDEAFFLPVEQSAPPPPPRKEGDRNYPPERGHKY